MKTILRGVVGSTAYGLDTPDSDVDRMGVFIAPTAQIVSFHPPKPSVVTTKPDQTMHEVGKFLSLVLRCNPSVTELLWLGRDRDSYERFQAPWAQELIAMRKSFLSAELVKNAYLGYATQQFKKLTERPDGTFGPDLAKRTEKHARHLRRLVDQGYDLYTKGRLSIRVPNPEDIHEFGRRVAEDPQIAVAYMARAEDRFRRAHTVLPDAPDTIRAERWLVHLRRDNWEG